MVKKKENKGYEPKEAFLKLAKKYELEYSKDSLEEIEKRGITNLLVAETQNYVKKKTRDKETLNIKGIAFDVRRPLDNIAEEQAEENEKEEQRLLTLLRNSNLFNYITEKEFDKKIVREIDARKTIFLNTCMRLVENRSKGTDNLNVNAKTGTGKDAVSEAVYAIIPDDEKEELIRITPKVLAYTRNKIFDEEATWKKIALRLEDVANQTLNDDGFKVMLTSDPNKINRAKIVWKGRIINYEIEGKPSITMTMANPNPKEENLRRCPTCFLDEGIDQTKEILERQAEYAREGKSLEYDEYIKKALSYLQVVKVKIPFAKLLVNIFNPQEVIVRTHFPRFLDYIKASCAFHQYQRQVDKDDYYIAEEQDYEIARIALIKTTTNILMIPTTKLQDDILNCFEKHNITNKSVDDLSEFKEIEKLNITNEWLRRQLDWLVSKTFLLKAKEKRTDESGKIIPKPVFVYSFNHLQKLIVPSFQELTQISLNSKNSKNTSNSSFTSNTNKKGSSFTFDPKTSNSRIKPPVNEVNEVKNPKVHMYNNDEKDKKSDESDEYSKGDELKVEVVKIK